ERHRSHAHLLAGGLVAPAGVRDHRLERDAGGEGLRERALRPIAAQQRRRRAAERDLEPEHLLGAARGGAHVQLRVEHQRGPGQLVERPREQLSIAIGRVGAAWWARAGRHRATLPAGGSRRRSRAPRLGGARRPAPRITLAILYAALVDGHPAERRGRWAPRFLIALVLVAVAAAGFAIVFRTLLAEAVRAVAGVTNTVDAI